MILGRDFYMRDTCQVAADLLGKVLVRHMDGHILAGAISETEAYGHTDDPASHAYRRMTHRNRAMFGQVGCAYVYFTYGMHYCFNVVARPPEREAGAVLVRAMHPRSGLDTMVANRGRDCNIADGPAKLAQAMGITAEQYGWDLTVKNGLYITDGEAPRTTRTAPRVGVRDPKPWNYQMV